MSPATSTSAGEEAPLEPGPAVPHSTTVPVIYSKISQASIPFFKLSVAGIKSLEDTTFPAPFKDRAAEPSTLGLSRAIGRKLAVR